MANDLKLLNHRACGNICRMSQVNEQVERRKRDVESPAKRPVVPPSKTGTGIIQEDKLLTIMFNLLLSYYYG